jgi:hypothetical protein
MQQKLAKAGATRIATEYDNAGEPCGMSFTVRTRFGMAAFTLPVDWEAVSMVLYKQGHAVEDARARRVAWRIVKDWLEAQLALIETEMVTLDQVMLPYMHTASGETVYEMVTEQQLALEQG